MVDVVDRESRDPSTAGTDGSEARHIASLLRPAVIAIDGPAASGKTTVGQMLADIVNYLLLDTGVMYRAITWAAGTAEVDFADPEATGDVARRVNLDVSAGADNEKDPRRYAVYVDGTDVSDAIRLPWVDRAVSAVSASHAVREVLSRRQREIGRRYGHGDGDKAGIVMVGRDIGTVVMPDAPLKIYMDASLAERARRRYWEQRAKGKQVAFEQVMADMERRDKLDSQRVLSPLRPADDAYIIDTSNLTPEEAVQRILAKLAEVIRRWQVDK